MSPAVRGFSFGGGMSDKFSIGEVIFSDGVETLLYGWIDAEEAIKALEDFFDETIELSDIQDGLHEYWKFVPCRNNPEGYPGMYYPCDPKTREAIKVTRVVFK